MKYLISLLIFSMSILFARGEIIVLNQKMTEAEALATPYSINKTVNSNSIELDISINMIEIVDFEPIPGKKICRIPGFQINSTPELPQYPVLILKYNIPSVDNCEVEITTQYYEYLTVEIAPGTEVLTASDQKGHTILPIKEYEGFYPNCIAKQNTIQYYKGLPIHYFSITPVSYNDDNKQAKITCRFKVKIIFEKNVEDLEEYRSDVFKANRRQEMLSQCDMIDWNQEEYIPVTSQRTQDILLIVNSVGMNYGSESIQKYVEWKNQLGFKVHVVGDKFQWTVDELQALITEKYYELDNLKYVLLMGWYSQLPGVPFEPYLLATEGHYWPHNNNPSYTAYSLINGYDDFTPKFAVGRLHPLNVEQADSIINKIIEYEKNPVTDPFFYSNAFLVSQFEPEGVELNKTTPSTYDKEDLGFIQWLERVRPILVDNGVNAKRIYKRHSILESAGIYPFRWTSSTDVNIRESNIPGFTYPTPYEQYVPVSIQYPNFKWDGTVSDIQESLRSGSFLGIYYGHGSNTGLESFYKFGRNEYIAAKSGSKPSLIFSISCSTGDNTWEGSLANYLSREEHGPIGMFASADYSQIPGNQYLLYGLVHALWPNYISPGGFSYFKNRKISYRLGDILNSGMDFSIDNIPDFRQKMHHRLTYTCFGDPSIDIYTETPTTFVQPIIEHFGPFISVDLEQQHNHEFPVYINFYEKENNRVESYEYNGKNYYFEASENVDSVLVSITSHNKIPYFQYVHGTDDNWAGTRPYGKITNVKFDATHGDLLVYFDINQDYEDYKLSMIPFDQNLSNPNKMQPMEVVLDKDETGYAYAVPTDFNGYIQLYLIHNNVILDAQKILVNFTR